jgi:hypothetical protein
MAMAQPMGGVLRLEGVFVSMIVRAGRHSPSALPLTLSFQGINGKLAIDGESKLVNIKSRPASKLSLPPPRAMGLRFSWGADV